MAVIEAIQTTYLEADAVSVLFESIPTGYEHLQLRTSVASDSTINDGVYREWGFVYFNTSTATTNSDYSHQSTGGRSTSVTAGATTGAHHIVVQWIGGTSLGVAHFGSCVLDILDYRNGSKNTSTMSFSGSLGPSTGSSENALVISGGLWDSVTAVDKILLIPDLGSNWRRGSEFTLYGIQE